MDLKIVPISVSASSSLMEREAELTVKVRAEVLAAARKSSNTDLRMVVVQRCRCLNERIEME